ncbi:phage antirepressor KilAC domain-containing protein [Lactococcus garvieae]|nr:phage antirepressor KilAC domain-containing protein [Lactococcus garvieae]USI70453.1 phage antirepressor KilAC domain-containing protein [Lactococcus garvieae subsp. garvieae]
MNQLQNFNFNNLQVRTVLIESEPWFVVADVAKAIEATNPTDLAKLVDDEDKSRQSLGSGSPKNIINESGLYQILLRSNNRNAKPFRKWVTREVLPTIRKHGAYMTDAKLEEALLNPDILIDLATQLKDERQARLGLEKENSQLNLELAEATEKTRYLDLILDSPDELIVKQIAQDYGMSAVKFNQILNKLRIQYKQNNQWLLYSRYQGKGYIRSRTFNYIGNDNKQHTRINTCWTQKGREFLYRKLKRAGYLPVVEQEVA